MCTKNAKRSCRAVYTSCCIVCHTRQAFLSFLPRRLPHSTGHSLFLSHCLVFLMFRLSYLQNCLYFLPRRLSLTPHHLSFLMRSVFFSTCLSSFLSHCLFSCRSDADSPAQRPDDPKPPSRPLPPMLRRNPPSPSPHRAIPTATRRSHSHDTGKHPLRPVAHGLATRHRKPMPARRIVLLSKSESPLGKYLYLCRQIVKAVTGCLELATKQNHS